MRPLVALWAFINFLLFMAIVGVAVGLIVAAFHFGLTFVLGKL